MNQAPFDPSGTDGRVSIKPGEGTLLFHVVLEKDDGVYQCTASNNLGSALTINVHLATAGNTGKRHRHLPL